MITLPEILNLPTKLMPMVLEFNRYILFLIEGGRGSGKSHSVARLLLYVAEQNKVRVVCGREFQNNIEESVYTLLKDLIAKYNLNYEVYKAKIVHRVTGSEFTFKGFREQGATSIKGLEGVDILWIDEAQSVTKTTLDVIMPTIRKENSRVIFTMNRFMRDDAVPEYCIGKENCLHIQINYFENNFCPLNLKIQAEDVKRKSERDYRHIWLGEPLKTADDYLFNFDKLHASFDIVPRGDPIQMRQRVLGIDFAAQGNDQCVATVIDRVTAPQWRMTERIPWDEPDTMVSVGKIVNIIGQTRPDVTIMDIGGMGKPVFDRLNEVGMNIIPFDGGSTNGIDTGTYANTRAEAYFQLREWFDQGFLMADKKDIEVIKQLEKIKAKFRSNGVRIIQAKVDMKKEIGYSPDDADSLMMAVWGAHRYLGRTANTISTGNDYTSGIQRRTIRRR